MAKIEDRTDELTLGFLKQRGYPEVVLRKNLPMSPRSGPFPLLPALVDIPYLCVEYEKEWRIGVPPHEAIEAPNYGAMKQLVTRLCREKGITADKRGG